MVGLSIALGGDRPTCAGRWSPARRGDQLQTGGLKTVFNKTPDGTGAGGRLASAPVRPSLSVLIVAWNSSAELRRTLPPLLAELGGEDELIVVDNASGDDSAAAVAELAPAARMVLMGRNVGFAAGCNRGAEEARGDLLVLLNPDAVPQSGWGEAIRRPWREGRGWAAWQALVANGDGTEINSAGNPVHFTGIVWAGGHGRRLAEAPPAGEVVCLSGACLAIPLATWRELGGFPERFFLYHEDVDLSLRLRLRGDTLGIEPAAVVAHDYEFGASEHKWRWLERNRLAFLVRNYPTRLLVLLAPALLATEVALLAVSASGGWGGQKLAANLEALRWLPRLLRERRRIQRARAVGSAEFASWLTADLDSPFIAAAARSLPARLTLRAYWAAVRALLGRR
jgi:N-acetylglucosaminyl-diphospho-decaprenol L-rhamnosyltransferase